MDKASSLGKTKLAAVYNTYLAWENNPVVNIVKPQHRQQVLSLKVSVCNGDRSSNNLMVLFTHKCTFKSDFPFFSWYVLYERALAGCALLKIVPPL